jgi:hypothetical protein
VTRSERTEPEGDLSSVAAFSLLFLVPAALAVVLWVILKGLDRAIGFGFLPFDSWVLVVLSPAIASAAIAQWACRRAGTGATTAWGFSVAAALVTILFAIVAAAWLFPIGE